MIENIQYCLRCCLPETVEGIEFDSFGFCTACQSSENKMHIDWVRREKKLAEILIEQKQKAGDNYDCILPCSGGKDSFFQAHVLVKKYGMKPLAVTFSHNWYSEIGLYNLHLMLETFDLDHFQFTPSRKLIGKLAKKSLQIIGDTCWHCHSGVGSFPLHIATKFRIPMLVWGEPVSESAGRGSHEKPLLKFDRDYFNKVSAKIEAEKYADDNITKKDIFPFVLPSYKEIEGAGVFGIHLGDYIFWDEERQTEFIKKEYGWKEDNIEGAYKGYKSAECVMPGMHDFTCYLKRGFGRATWQGAVDVRNGLMTKEEAFQLIDKIDPVVPKSIEYYKEITGYTEEEIFEIIAKKRHPLLKNMSLPMVQSDSKETIMPFLERLVRLHKQNPNTKTIIKDK